MSGEAEPHLGFRHVVGGNARGEAEVDLRPLPSAGVHSPHPRQRVSEHALVERDPHELDVTGLLLSKQVSGAPEVEVARRDGEPRAEPVERLQERVGGFEKGSMEKIIWTPAASEAHLGTVIMPRPQEPLTLERYRGALSSRIDRMVLAAGERAAKILSGAVEDEENLSVSGHPETAGDVLAWDSEILANRSGMLLEDWPIPPGRIKQEIDLRVEDLEEVALEEYLGMLYHGAP